MKAATWCSYWYGGPDAWPGSTRRGRRVTGLSQQVASKSVLAPLLQEEGLLQSSHHKAPLTIGFPPHVLSQYFPDL